MSYDLSFKKSQLWLLGGLVLLGAVLLVVGGYLLGRMVAPPVAVALPVVALPAVAGKTGSGVVSAGSPSVAVVPAVTMPAGGSADTTSSPGTAAPAARGGYALQFGAFHDPENAAALAKSLTEKGTKVAVTTMHNSLGESLAVVRFGSYASSDEALHAARVQAALLNTTVVVRPADRM